MFASIFKPHPSVLPEGFRPGQVHYGFVILSKCALDPVISLLKITSRFPIYSKSQSPYYGSTALYDMLPFNSLSLFPSDSPS